MQEVKLNEFSATMLTNIRVRQKYTDQVKSALLSEVNGSALRYQHHPWLIMLGVMFFLVGVWWHIDSTKNADYGSAFVIMGIILIVAYLASRQVSLEIYAGAMVIHEKIEGANKSMAQDFIESLESAKQRYEHQRMVSAFLSKPKSQNQSSATTDDKKETSDDRWKPPV